MFLIKTAERRLWKLDEPVLLLGRWCKTYDNRSVWEQVPHEVLPYHWDDRERLAADSAYADRLYERVLVGLAHSLNRVHATDHSLRYWRIVIGPWLSQFLFVLLDRHLSLVGAVECEKVSNTYVPELGEEWVPQDITPFVRSVGDSDRYNEYLYGWLIRRLEGFPYEVRDGLEPVDLRATPWPRPLGLGHRSKRALVRAWKAISKWVPPRLKRIVLVTSSLSPGDQVRLELSLGQIPTWDLPDVMVTERKFDPGLRAQLSCLDPTSKFETLLDDAIRDHCPLVYLENYRTMREQSLEAYPRRPSVIFTSTSFYANEAFKLWSAEHVERGAKLVGTQHGGHYGTARWYDSEDHERRIYDRFYSWGWTADRQPANVTPLAAAKFNGAVSKVRSDPRGSVLLTTFMWPRYAYRAFSAPVASWRVLQHLEEQFRFVQALSREAREVLTVRLFPNDRGWGQRERWAERFPKVQCYQGPKKFLHQLNECRLLVTTCTSTTHLEGFAADFPTLLFWDPNVFELRPSAQPYFDRLARAGILFTTPEAAAERVNDIVRDPLGWWKQPTVQRAKNTFCERYARTSPHWRREWKGELLSLAQVSDGRGHSSR